MKKIFLLITACGLLIQSGNLASQTKAGNKNEVTVPTLPKDFVEKDIIEKETGFSGKIMSPKDAIILDEYQEVVIRLNETAQFELRVSTSDNDYTLEEVKKTIENNQVNAFEVNNYHFKKYLYEDGNSVLVEAVNEKKEIHYYFEAVVKKNEKLIHIYSVYSRYITSDKAFEKVLQLFAMAKTFK